MFYPDNVLEEVRSANDIVDVISSYVSLKKKGSSYFGLCPFHSEKTPSFSVSPGKQIYYCFGCQKGGNVISFVMEYENDSFAEAVERLAERAGISLPKREATPEEKRAADRRERLFAVNKEAGRYYYYKLRENAGQRAYQYLKNRGLSDETMKGFGLGFAQTGTNMLYRYLRSRGFEDELLAKSGIFNVDGKRGMTDKFWNRVIFPIMDVRDRVIGFGGRVMGEGEPKYLNSPETEIFDKGRNLYGLNIAKRGVGASFIVCEGYMDVISLHQAGFRQAVASLGTALTQAQSRIMGRYVKEVLLSYDSDGAGVNATLRALGIMRESGIACRVVNLLPYKDPDELIKNLGPEAYEERLRQAENGFYFELRQLEKEYDLGDPEGKTRFFRETAKRLTRFEDSLERENYLEGVAEKYHVQKESLYELVKKQAMLSENIPVYERPRPAVREKGKAPDRGALSAGTLLGWLCEDPKLYPIISPYLKPEDFPAGIYRTAAEQFFAQLSEGRADPSAVIDHFTEESERSAVAAVFGGENSGALSEISASHNSSERDKALKELLLSVREAALSERARALSGGDVTATQDIINQRKKLEELRLLFSRQSLL
ncbi:MAG: DNA primase [Lachnospiraceae bacterium]|nr:DNA primase [Lachnospiraceae bacterium]